MGKDPTDWEAVGLHDLVLAFFPSAFQLLPSDVGWDGGRPMCGPKTWMPIHLQGTHHHHQVWEGWCCHTCGLLRLDTSWAWFLSWNIYFRPCLKWKDARVTELARWTTTVGIWCYGSCYCHVASWCDAHRTCSFSKKWSYWWICKICFLKWWLFFCLTPASLGNSPLRWMLGSELNTAALGFCGYENRLIWCISQF